MLNLRSIAAWRLAKNSPLDYFCPAMQCRSLCFRIGMTGMLNHQLYFLLYEGCRCEEKGRKNKKIYIANN